MYCPLLLIKQTEGTTLFGQCLKEACAWWIAAENKCAVCKNA